MVGRGTQREAVGKRDAGLEVSLSLPSGVTLGKSGPFARPQSLHYGLEHCLQ